MFREMYKGLDRSWNYETIFMPWAFFIFCDRRMKENGFNRKFAKLTSSSAIENNINTTYRALPNLNLSGLF